MGSCSHCLPGSRWVIWESLSVLGEEGSTLMTTRRVVCFQSFHYLTSDWSMRPQFGLLLLFIQPSSLHLPQFFSWMGDVFITRPSGR